MLDATPKHVWLVAQTLRRLARLPFDQANRPGLRVMRPTALV
jgi:hypothetical protein